MSETKSNQANKRTFLIDDVIYETVRGGRGEGERLPVEGDRVVVTKIDAELIKPKVSRVIDVTDETNATPTGIFKINPEINDEYNVYTDKPNIDEYYVVTSAKLLADIGTEQAEAQAKGRTSASESDNVNQPDNVDSPDTVDSPSHYTAGDIEVIDIIAQTVAGYSDPFVGHCVGTSTKYLNRAPYKNNLLEDLKKGRAYLDFAIKHMEDGDEYI